MGLPEKQPRLPDFKEFDTIVPEIESRAGSCGRGEGLTISPKDGTLRENVRYGEVLGDGNIGTPDVLQQTESNMGTVNVDAVADVRRNVVVKV